MQILDGKQKNLLRFQEFFIKNRKFHSEFANYLQNAVIFVNNSQEICRTQLILSIIRKKFAEHSEFRQKFANYLQNTAISDEKREFLNRKRGASPGPSEGGGARTACKLICSSFCSPPSEGPGEAFIFTPLLWRGRGRLRLFCRIQRFPSKNQS